MADEKKIVFLDVATPEMREVLSEHLPPGFTLTFADAASDEAEIAAVADADYVLVLASYMRAPVVEACKRARLIQKMGEGTDRIDVATAARLGIPVAKTSGSNSNAVAELATLLILSTIRWLPRAHNSMLAGQWLKFEIRPGSFELRGKQVGIIGLGKIGKRVAQQVQGFDTSVVYYDIVRLSPQDEAARGVRFMPLDELLRTSDVVTLHVPLNPSTRGMIGQREIELMKPTAVLINTCRGAVVHEEALCQALQRGRIRGAGIDVYSKEPPGKDCPLYSLDNVVLTPHMGGSTDTAETEGVKHSYANIVKVSRGEALDPADIAPIPALA